MAYRVGIMVARAATTKPAANPYHVKWFDEITWENTEVKKPVFVQKKYDGMHIQLSWKYGARGHRGSVPNELAIVGLAWLEDNDDEFLELLEFLHRNEEFVATIELFGSKITPAGYHRGWNKPFDFRVLDVHVLGRWLPPTQWLEVLPKPAHTEVFDEIDVEALKDLALRDDWYEGAVIKQYGDEFSQDPYYVGHGLRIAKFKPKELINVPERFSRGRMKELFVEVKDELDKNPRTTIEEIMEYLREAHPELLGKNEEKTRGIVNQIMRWYRYARK